MKVKPFNASEETLVKNNFLSALMWYIIPVTFNVNFAMIYVIKHYTNFHGPICLLAEMSSIHEELLFVMVWNVFGCNCPALLNIMVLIICETSKKISFIQFNSASFCFHLYRLIMFFLLRFDFDFIELFRFDSFFYQLLSFRFGNMENLAQ